MTQLAFPIDSHFAQEFSFGVEAGVSGDPHPRHPRGLYRAGKYINKGRDQGLVHTQVYTYTVPDGSDPMFPTPVVGDRIYVGRWLPDQVFIGGWGYASDFSGLGDLKAEYSDGVSVQTVNFTNAAGLSANADYTKFEIQAVNEENPTSEVVDLFYELTTAPAAGEILKGRLDFVG